MKNNDLRTLTRLALLVAIELVMKAIAPLLVFVLIISALAQSTAVS